MTYHEELISTKDDYNKFLNSDKPTIGLFTADWCGSCKQMVGYLEKASTELGKDIYLINVDSFTTEVSQLGIAAIPATIVTDKGKGRVILRGDPGSYEKFIEEVTKNRGA